MTGETLPRPGVHLGLPVAPGEITAGLRALWAENETATRASLMNLAIYGESPDALIHNTQCVHELTREHACRVLLIEARPSSPDKHTEAWITAHCSLGPGGRKAVCCEQIAFLMHGFSHGRLANLLFANLDSDLPLILWWQASFSEHFHRRIYSRVGRLIIDSQTWAHPKAEFTHLLAAHVDDTQHFVIHDLNWTRTFHLRLAITAGFDEPQAVSKLRDVHTIEIAHGPGYDTTANLLGKWLLEKLRSSQATDAPPKLGLLQRGTHAIAHLAFHTATATMKIERSGDRFYTWTSPPHPVPRHFPADPDDLSSLLIDQLGRREDHAAYLRIGRQYFLG